MTSSKTFEKTGRIDICTMSLSPDLNIVVCGYFSNF